MPPSKKKLKLVGSDKESPKKGKRRDPENEAPEILHFPECTPWGARPAEPQSPRDILDTIEQQIDRAQETLKRLGEEADVLFRFTDSDDDDDTPSAA